MALGFTGFMDDKTRMMVGYAMERKSSLAKFKIFNAMVANQLATKIRVLRTDGGGEYGGKDFDDFLESFGIIQQRSAPYSTSQNGRAELSHRTVFEMVRVMLNTAGLPGRLSVDAV